MSKKKIKDMVKEQLEGFLSQHDYELYSVEYEKKGRDWFLRVCIDRPEHKEGPGIGTDDCELVSRWLGDRLDELDPIDQNYYLEVSSPGMDRPLLTEAHYRKYAGRPVVMTLYQAQNGKKTIHGTLEGLKDGVVTVTEDGGGTLYFPLEKIAKTRLEVIF